MNFNLDAGLNCYAGPKVSQTHVLKNVSGLNNLFSVTLNTQGRLICFCFDFKGESDSELSLNAAR